MNKTEKDLIKRLFDKIGQAAMQPTPRDIEAERLINDKIKEIPGASYYMAQTLVVQRQALKQAEARIAQLEQHLGVQPGGPGSSLAYQQNGYGRGPGYYGQSQQQYYDNRSGFGGFGGGGGFSGGGGFLAGAAQTALGVAGGVLLANAAMSLFDGFGNVAGDLFNDNPVESFAGNPTDFSPGDDSGFDQGGDFGEGGGFFDAGGGDDW